MQTVIVGGVAGGMSAATRLRRLDASAEIVVLERSGYVSFANCGLPYYLGGVIEQRDALLLQTPQSLRTRFDIDVRVRQEALSIDRAARTVRVRDLASGAEYDEPYDALVLSPGARPFVPPTPGIERALTLRTVEDVDQITAALDQAGPQASAVVLGGGFIGLEVAENLARRGLVVTVVELADQVLTALDPELAALVQHRLEDNQVQVRTGTQASEITADEVVLSSGERLAAQVVVAAIGVRPDSSLAADAGLEVSDRGGIVVDEHQRTSDPAVYAVGDATTTRDLVTGVSTLTPLANPANRQGRLVADVIAGRTPRFPGVQGTAVIGVFGLTAAVTGWNESRARADGRPYRVIHTHPADHAGYYPGAQSMSLKLVVDAESDAILGAQGVGGNGVDKRIDVIATAIRGGLRASQLAELELAYAPAYGSAKDPVTMLGFIAENLAAGLVETIQWYELDEAVAAGAQLVDVRSPAEHARGTIPGAVNIPVDELPERAGEIRPGAVVFCQVGLRGYLAVRSLVGVQVPVRNLDGGYRTWSRT